MAPRSNLIALLAVIAAAGFQNRDKIADLLKNLQGAGANPGAGNTGAGIPGTGDLDTASVPGSTQGTAPGQADSGLGGILGQLANGGLGGLLGGASTGSILSGGLGGLLDQFSQSGLGDRADTWVKSGPNEEIRDDELSQALGDDVLDELAQKTGLSREEILSRLSKNLPGTIDALTPDGAVPAEEPFPGEKNPLRY